VGVEAGSDEATFEVADTGAGIAPEHLLRVFKRFYRVEKSRSRDDGGSGVGLAISRALVEAMGGRIWAESPGPGEGATFAFTLAISRPES
jgi:signal transduction histidine kinase